ncbi:MAG: hypothetical protein ACOCQN_01590 [Halanaerobiaceae bacterium]
MFSLRWSQWPWVQALVRSGFADYRQNLAGAVKYYLQGRCKLHQDRIN